MVNRGGFEQILTVLIPHIFIMFDHLDIESFHVGFI